MLCSPEETRPFFCPRPLQRFSTESVAHLSFSDRCRSLAASIRDHFQAENYQKCARLLADLTALCDSSGRFHAGDAASGGLHLVLGSALAQPHTRALLLASLTCLQSLSAHAAFSSLCDPPLVLRLLSIARDPSGYLAGAEFDCEHFAFLPAACTAPAVRGLALSALSNLIAASQAIRDFALSQGTAETALSLCATDASRFSLALLGNLYAHGPLPPAPTEAALACLAGALCGSDPPALSSALTALRCVCESDPAYAAAGATALPPDCGRFLDAGAPAVASAFLSLLTSLLPSGAGLAQRAFAWAAFPSLWASAARSALLRFCAAFVAADPPQCAPALSAVSAVLGAFAGLCFRGRCEAFAFLAAASTGDPEALALCVGCGALDFALDALDADPACASFLSAALSADFSLRESDRVRGALAEAADGRFGAALAGWAAVLE